MAEQSIFPAEVTEFFFDSDKIKEMVERANKQNLRTLGRLTQKEAKESIRKKQTVSRPGQPPTNVTGRLKKFIRFYYDPQLQAVIIGPEKVSDSDAQKTLESGGEVKIPDSWNSPADEHHFRAGKAGPVLYGDKIQEKLNEINNRRFEKTGRDWGAIYGDNPTMKIADWSKHINRYGVGYLKDKVKAGEKHFTADWQNWTEDIPVLWRKLESAGMVDLANRIWVIINRQRREFRTDKKTGKVAPRPYMSPALDRIMKKFPDLWKDSLDAVLGY